MDDVKLYSNFNTMQQTLNKTIINQKLHLLKFDAGENLFEIGCGTGGSTKTLLRHVPPTFNKYVATDKLATMVNDANADNAKVHFDQLDVTDERIRDEWVHNFDKVFSFVALQWVEIQLQSRAFRNMNTLLKRNGCIFISMVADTPLYDAYRKLQEDSRWAAYTLHERETRSPFTKDNVQSLKNVLKENRFELIDMEFMDIKHQFETLDECKNTVKAVNPFISRIPTELHDAYWGDLWKALERFSDVAKSSLLTTMLFIAARKVDHVV